MRCQNAFGDFDIVTMYLPDERDKEPDNRLGYVSSAIKWKDVNSFNVQEKMALWTTWRHIGGGGGGADGGCGFCCCGVGGRIATFSLNFNTRWRWVARFTSRPP